MQLRKCCNHPFLLTGVENEVRSQKPNTNDVDSLVNSSGKFVLLDKLLPRLKADGHRILLFSQFKIMLDIIEDYLHLRDFKCERIDGSITGMKRQAAIDRFQSKDNSGREQPFIMLLSTRAGGVGINLTAADTCVSYVSILPSCEVLSSSTHTIYLLLRSYLTLIGTPRMTFKPRRDGETDHSVYNRILFSLRPQISLSTQQPSNRPNKECQDLVSSSIFPHINTSHSPSY